MLGTTVGGYWGRFGVDLGSISGGFGGRFWEFFGSILGQTGQTGHIGQTGQTEGQTARQTAGQTAQAAQTAQKEQTDRQTIVPSTRLAEDAGNNCWEHWGTDRTDRAYRAEPDNCSQLATR